MCRKDYNDRWQCKALVTLRERSCGKVMLAVVSVSHSVWRGPMLPMLPMLPYYQCCIEPHHTGIHPDPSVQGHPSSPIHGPQTAWTTLYRIPPACSNLFNSDLTVQGSPPPRRLFIMKHVQLGSRRLASYWNAFLVYCEIATDCRQSDDPPGARRWMWNQVWRGNRTAGERWNHVWRRTRFAICMASKLTQLCTSLPCYSEPQSRA